MKNPLRSEAEAFRFLLGSIVYFALIALATALGGRWVGLGVFLAESAVVFWLWLRSRQLEQAPRRQTSTAPHPAGERRILVVANETVGGRSLQESVARAATGQRNEVLVVSPALNSPLKHWVSDEDGARAAAQLRLDASLARLAADGFRARGEVGDADPIQAIEDALRTFGADEIIISTHPEGRSHWLEQDLVARARDRFAVQITHVVVDLDAEREEIH